MVIFVKSKNAIFMKRLFLFSAIVLGLMAPLSAQDSDFASKVDDYVKQVMETWQIPGASVAVSVDNKVVFMKAYGVKELRPADGVGFAGVKYDECKFTQAGVKPVVNKPGDLVKTSSMFQIASVSKSFTATVMAQLVNEGKFKWTDTVKKLLPDFEMFKDNPYVSNNMLVRDALLHSTGLVDEAGTYFGNLGYDREDTYKLLGFLKPGFSFRSGYDYNNITFVVCSKLIEKYTGKSWEDNVRERVFKPLGMKSSTMNADGFAAAKDVVTPPGSQLADRDRSGRQPCFQCGRPDQVRPVPLQQRLYCQSRQGRKRCGYNRGHAEKGNASSAPRIYRCKPGLIDDETLRNVLVHRAEPRLQALLPHGNLLGSYSHLLLCS